MLPSFATLSKKAAHFVHLFGLEQSEDTKRMAASTTGNQGDRGWDKAGHPTPCSSSRPLQDKDDSPAQIVTVKLPPVATRADKPPKSLRWAHHRAAPSSVRLAQSSQLRTFKPKSSLRNIFGGGGGRALLLKMKPPGVGNASSD